MKPYYDEDGITIYHGDCREVLKELPPKSVDLVLTDPPYGIGKAVWDFDVEHLITAAAGAVSRVLTDEGMSLWFCSISLLPQTMSWVSQSIPYRWLFIWHSPNRMQPGPLGFMKYTPALVCSRASIHRNMADVFSLSNPPRGPEPSDHPTMKPLRLMTHLVARMSVASDVILDPFMGSGTTLRAAKEMGRRAIGIEIEERYCEMAVQRLAQGVLTFG